MIAKYVIKCLLNFEPAVPLYIGSRWRTKSSTSCIASKSYFKVLSKKNETMPSCCTTESYYKDGPRKNKNTAVTKNISHASCKRTNNGMTNSNIAISGGESRQIENLMLLNATANAITYMVDEIVLYVQCATKFDTELNSTVKNQWWHV